MDVGTVGHFCTFRSPGNMLGMQAFTWQNGGVDGIERCTV